ncbi:hypothetical protein C8R45DRAFT_1097257 [Mycena sanguinolenta]|nr:hypothetical protein C8R45DRAFT_1097257 [Mycena sanguinolenta]
MSSVHDSAASQPNADTDTEVSHIWTKLKPGIKEILNTGKAPDFALYTSLYSDIFNCCSSANLYASCDALHSKVESFFEAYTAKICAGDPVDYMLLADYYDSQWNRFQQGVLVVNRLFAPLNRHFAIPAEPFHRGRKDLPPVLDVALAQWKKQVFDRFLRRLEWAGAPLQAIQDGFAAGDFTADKLKKMRPQVYVDGIRERNELRLSFANSQTTQTPPRHVPKLEHSPQPVARPHRGSFMDVLGLHSAPAPTHYDVAMESYVPRLLKRNPPSHSTPPNQATDPPLRCVLYFEALTLLTKEPRRYSRRARARVDKAGILKLVAVVAFRHPLPLRHTMDCRDSFPRPSAAAEVFTPGAESVPHLPRSWYQGLGSILLRLPPLLRLPLCPLHHPTTPRCVDPKILGTSFPPPDYPVVDSERGAGRPERDDVAACVPVLIVPVWSAVELLVEDVEGGVSLSQNHPHPAPPPWTSRGSPKRRRCLHLAFDIFSLGISRTLTLAMGVLERRRALWTDCRVVVVVVVRAPSALRIQRGEPRAETYSFAVWAAAFQREADGAIGLSHSRRAPHREIGMLCLDLDAAQDGRDLRGEDEDSIIRAPHALPRILDLGRHPTSGRRYARDLPTFAIPPSVFSGHCELSTVSSCSSGMYTVPQFCAFHDASRSGLPVCPWPRPESALRLREGAPRYRCAQRYLVRKLLRVRKEEREGRPGA